MWIEFKIMAAMSFVLLISVALGVSTIDRKVNSVFLRMAIISLISELFVGFVGLLRYFIGG